MFLKSKMAGPPGFPPALQAQHMARATNYEICVTGPNQILFYMLYGVGNGWQSADGANLLITI